MPYKNPPVIEVGVSVHFSTSAADCPTWTESNGKAFVDRLGQAFTQPPEFLYKPQLQKAENATTTAISVLDSVLYRENDQIGILCICPDDLRYNRFRKESCCPRYHEIVDGLLKYLPHYMDFWKPQNIATITLVYADNLYIPSENFNHDDYFRIRTDIPDAFGTVAFYTNHLACQSEDGEILFQLRFGKTISDRQNHHLFQLFWDCTKIVRSGDIADIEQELDVLHEFIIKRFELTLTDKCKQLLKPQTTN
jgi:uncharacterized protein (TIGR04255 family)